MHSIKEKLQTGEMIPFIGMEIFKDVKTQDNSILPYDSDSMILALNKGRAMSKRLMYEYSRAAMSLEHRRGRDYIVQMTNHIYSSKVYDIPKIYKLLKESKAPYIIDTTLDNSLQKTFSNEKHFLITGVARISEKYDRFISYVFNENDKSYKEIKKEELSLDFPILFKPLGSCEPEHNFIISDADFVDWITEAMGGFALPSILKEYRKDKEYLFIGMDFSKDTFRMVANEISLDLKGGISLINKEELTKKESKFIKSHNIINMKQSINEFIQNYE